MVGNVLNVSAGHMERADSAATLNQRDNRTLVANSGMRPLKGTIIVAASGCPEIPLDIPPWPLRGGPHAARRASITL